MHTGKQIDFAHETILFLGFHLYRDDNKNKNFFETAPKSHNTSCVNDQTDKFRVSVHILKLLLFISLGEKNGVLHISLWLASSPEPLHLLNSNFLLTCLLVSVNSSLIASSKKLYLQRTDAEVLCQKIGVSTFHKERGGVPWPHKFFTAQFILTQITAEGQNWPEEV